MFLQSSSGNAPDTGIAPIAVLVVDDQLSIREGVARLILSAPIAVRAIGKASTCEEARAIAASLCPELVVLDADLAGQDGLALIGQLGPAARVLVLSSHGDARTRDRAKRRGASGFVAKHQPAADLLRSIMEIATAPAGGTKLPGGRA